MGILDFIFGGQDTDGKTKTKTASTQTTTSDKLIGQDQVQATSDRNTTAATTQNRTTGTNTGNLLTHSEQGILDALIGRAAGTDNVFGDETADAVGAQKSVAGNLAGKLGSFDSDLDTHIANAKASVAQDYLERTMPGIQHYADLVGSSGNSTVQLLKQQGIRNLDTALMGVEEDWRLKAGDQYNQLGQVAANAAAGVTSSAAGYEEGGAEALKNALGAIGTAKGASYTQSSDQLADTAQNTQSVEDKIIEAILAERDQAEEDTDVTTTSKGTSSGSTSGSLPGLLGSLSSFFNIGPSRGPIA